MNVDPTAFRAFAEIVSMSSLPAEVFARPAFAAQVQLAATDQAHVASAEGLEPV